MKSTVLRCWVFWVLSALVVCVFGEVAHAQQTKFTRKPLKQYWRDQNNQPWSDMTCRMAVRIDPLDAKDIPELSSQVEISSDESPPLTYRVGEWNYFSLKTDAQGAYADVEYLVRADSPEKLPYRVELQRANGSVRFVSGTNKVEIGNDSVSPLPIGLKDLNPITWKKWLTIAGIMLLGLILVYILIFRVLFRGLLFKRRWGVPSAEHFTWSMSLLVMLALASGLTLFYLGPRLETYVIICVMGAFWLLHAVVWMVSGKEA